MDLKEDLKQQLTLVLAPILNCPQELKLEELPDDKKVVSLKISCADSDIPLVIGKNGRMASALRVYMSSLGAKHDRRVKISILSSTGFGRRK